jgi:hypothetical protein
MRPIKSRSALTTGPMRNFFMRLDSPSRSVLSKSRKRLGMKWIRLTRSVFLAGEHAEKGSIHMVKKPLADDLIAQGSALPLRTGWRFVLAAACLVLGAGAVLWLATAHGWW